jgi:DNA-binding FadR family transcriptional regulator
MEEHRALVDSIAARDVERAQNAARIHLENAEHTLLKDMVESHNEKKNKE